MELKEPYETIRKVNKFENRIAPYIIIAILLVSVPIIIYNYFNLFSYFTEPAVVFCNVSLEKNQRIGVTSERFIDILLLFYGDPSKLEEFTENERQHFYNAVYKLDSCEEGYLFSKEHDGIRKLSL